MENPAVAIDLQTEKLLDLKQVPSHIPPHRAGKKVHPSTILRWVLDGVRAPQGARVRLEASRCGGRWVTSIEALQPAWLLRSMDQRHGDEA